MIVGLVTAAVSGHVGDGGAGSIRSQEEVEDVCVLEQVEVDPLFLGPQPPSSVIPLNPSVFPEKDQNLKYIFHSMDCPPFLKTT